MSIFDVSQPASEWVMLRQGFIDPIKDLIDDLDSQQKYREILLRQAQTCVGKAVQGGCVSEISIVENIHDSDEYQKVLNQLSEFFQSSSTVVYAYQLPELRVPIKIECYDESGFADVATFERVEGVLHISDDDLEELGYMGWLARWIG